MLGEVEPRASSHATFCAALQYIVICLGNENKVLNPSAYFCTVTFKPSKFVTVALLIMPTFTQQIQVTAPGKSTEEFTEVIAAGLRASGLREGTVTVFCCHTSCSLVIMENADPSARRDLERFIDRLVPEDDPDFTHTYEGPDDMPSHIKMALTRTAEVIPFVDGRLCLGTWQGVFLWEHRARPHSRRIVLSYQGV
jgi:secondary thiamine-phosphate synthase enzyme